MTPRKLGVLAALALLALTPAAVSSQSKDAGVTAAQRQDGMTNAPAIAQAAGITCQIADARLIGKVTNRQTKAEQSFYEIDCDQGFGFVLEAATGQAPKAFNCLQASEPGPDGKPSNLACKLPGNANSAEALGQLVQKGGVTCTPEKTRAIGANTTNSFFEVLCQGGAGYILETGAPPTLDKPVKALNCLVYDDANAGVSCTLQTKEQRLAVVDTFAGQAANGCVVKDRRFVLTSRDGTSYFEASCQDGKGYMYKSDTAGRFAQAIDCAAADYIGDGCKLTDTRAAKTEQAALYTRLAKGAGFDCNVESYGVLPSRETGKEVVELVCTGKPGAIGVFAASGPSSVVDCAHAPISGYSCALNKDKNFGVLTGDLKKLGKASCTVKDSRMVGTTAAGTTMLEVNCSDGLAGYMIEYVTATRTPKEAIGCAFAKGVGGGCKLPGNT